MRVLKENQTHPSSSHPQWTSIRHSRPHAHTHARTHQLIPAEQQTPVPSRKTRSPVPTSSSSSPPLPCPSIPPSLVLRLNPSHTHLPDRSPRDWMAVVEGRGPKAGGEFLDQCHRLERGAGPITFLSCELMKRGKERLSGGERSGKMVGGGQGSRETCRDKPKRMAVNCSCVSVCVSREVGSRFHSFHRERRRRER